MIKKDAQFWLRIAVAAFFCLLIGLVPWILVPFMLATFLCLLLRPLVELIMSGMHHIGWRRFPVDAAILLSFLIFVLVIVLLGNIIFVPFWHELELFIRHLPEITEQVMVILQDVQTQWLEFIPPDIQNMIRDLLIRAGNYLVELAQNGIYAIWTLTSTLVELIVVPIITFYMLKSGGRFKQAFAKLFPSAYRAHLLTVIEETDYMLSAYIRGQLILCCVMAAMVFAGMWCFDVPYPLVIALLAGMVELVPIVGPIVGAIPAVVLAATVSTSLMVKVLIFYIVVQQLDGHLLMPKLMGNVVQLHPVTIIAGVLLGSSLFGVFGMMLAVPALAVAKVVLAHLWYYNEARDRARTGGRIF